MPEPTKLMMAGDWHRHQRWAELALEHGKQAGCDYWLQLGDWGYWPPVSDPPELAVQAPCPYTQNVRHKAKTLGLPGYWVDGNHENHDQLTPGQGNEWLRHLPRGHRWQWWGLTWMSVGGAVSVDADNRLPGYDWFPSEVLSMEQLEHCLREGDVDVIVAHDAPDKVDIPGIHGQEKTKNTHSFFSPELIAQSEKHRTLMGIIADEKAPKYWFHGHYHQRYNAKRGDITVVGLDMDGTHLNLNTVILTPEVLEKGITE